MSRPYHAKSFWDLIQLFSKKSFYHQGFFAEGERFLSFCRCHRPRKRAALVMWCGWFKPRLEIRHAAALTIGAKHWHRQKAVFYVFVSVPQYFSTEPCYSLTRWPVDLKKNRCKLDFNGFNRCENFTQSWGGGWCGSSRICGGDSGAVVWGFLYVSNSFYTISKLWEGLRLFITVSFDNGVKYNI